MAVALFNLGALEYEVVVCNIDRRGVVVACGNVVQCVIVRLCYCPKGLSSDECSNMRDFLGCCCCRLLVSNARKDGNHWLTMFREKVDKADVSVAHA